MTRIAAILADPFYGECLTKISAREADRKFCCHTFQHFVDVARITYILMLESGVIKRFMEENDLNIKLAKELIYAAALLHDIGRWQEYETGEDHARVSARLAVDLLARAGFNGKEQRIIRTAIEEHRSITGEVSTLGGVLCRADKLSRLCTRCEASAECYKFREMDTGRTPLIY